MADPESSVQSVISSNDLLTEILVRLPLLSLVLFKSVSKRWLSLIKDANPTFRRNPDPVSGLFLDKYSSGKEYNDAISYDFVPFDIRIPMIFGSSLLSTKFTFGPEVQHVEIFDSCNGLLLCLTLSEKFYVYNPSISNMFKVLPEPDNVTSFCYSSRGDFKMAFDPSKSPYYKVMYAELVDGVYVQIHTYSSETGNWSSDEFFKLDIMNEHPVLTALPTPLTTDGKVHYRYSLFESRGCLLLVDKHNHPSKCFTIFEKGNGYSEWSVKYIVNLDDIIAKRLSIRERIYCIVLGEREEDSFLVWRLGRKLRSKQEVGVMPATYRGVWYMSVEKLLLREFRLKDPNLGSKLCLYLMSILLHALTTLPLTFYPSPSSSNTVILHFISFSLLSSQTQFLIPFNHHPFVIASFVVVYGFVTVDLIFRDYACMYKRKDSKWALSIQKESKGEATASKFPYALDPYDESVPFDVAPYTRLVLYAPAHTAPARSAGINDEKKTHGLRFLVEDYMQQESSQGSCYLNSRIMGYDFYGSYSKISQVLWKGCMIYGDILVCDADFLGLIYIFAA
ncbi:F-box protein-like protein [Tanacetum coccineum]